MADFERLPTSANIEDRRGARGRRMRSLPPVKRPIEEIIAAVREAQSPNALRSGLAEQIGYNDLVRGMDLSGSDLSHRRAPRPPLDGQRLSEELAGTFANIDAIRGDEPDIRPEPRAEDPARRLFVRGAQRGLTPVFGDGDRLDVVEELAPRSWADTLWPNGFGARP